MSVDLFREKAGPAPTDPKPDSGGLDFGLRIDIVFGMPKYNCRYHGLCRLDVDEQDVLGPILPQCGRGKGRLYLPHPAFALICFDKQQLTLHTRLLQFGRRYFELQEAVFFSPALTQRLGRQYFLPAGRYRINDKGFVYSVLFRINCAVV